MDKKAQVAATSCLTPGIVVKINGGKVIFILKASSIVKEVYGQE